MEDVIFTWSVVVALIMVCRADRRIAPDSFILTIAGGIPFCTLVVEKTMVADRLV